MARSPTLVSLLVVFGAFLGLVNAQSLSDLPSCAQPCANTAAIAAGCTSLNDAACLCKTGSFTTATQLCSGSVCPREDQSSVIGILREFCSSVSTTSQTSSTTSTKTTSSTSPSSTSRTTTNTSSHTTSSVRTSTQTTATPVTASTTSLPSLTSITITASDSTTLTSGGTTLVIPPSSTFVVVSTSTLLPQATGNAAVAIGKQGLGAFGTLIVGIFALL